MNTLKLALASLTFVTTVSLIFVTTDLTLDARTPTYDVGKEDVDQNRSSHSGMSCD